MRRYFQKSINSTWTNTRVDKNRIHKVPSSNCNHRLVYLREWHIQMEIDITNFVSLSDNINATLSLTLSFWSVGSSLSFIFLICWIESVDPVADLYLRNQILYRIILFSAVECFWIQINHWTAKYLPWNAARRCELVVWKAAKDGERCELVVARPWHTVRRWQNAMVEMRFYSVLLNAFEFK